MGAGEGERPYGDGIVGGLRLAGVGIVTGPREKRASVAGSISTRRGVGGCHPIEGSLLDGHVGVEVGLGGADVGMAEPKSDHGGVDSGLQKGHGAAVAQDMGMKFVRS